MNAPHYHGWALFGDRRVWEMACTADSRSVCNQLLHQKLSEPYWRTRDDYMVRVCRLKDCPYHKGAAHMM